MYDIKSMKTYKVKIVCLLVALTALLILCGAVALCAPTREIASAAEVTRTVLKAPTSNLVENRYAGKSGVKVLHNDDTFYIPESYFIEIEGKLFGNYYSAKYGDIEVFYESASAPQTQEMIFEENEKLHPEQRLYLAEGATANVGGRDVVDSDIIKLLGFDEDDTEIYCSVTDSSNVTTYGFIPRESLQPFNLPYQAKTEAERQLLIAEQAKPEEEGSGITEGGNIAPNTSLALRIVLIIGICVPAALIMVLLFKPSKEQSGKRNARRKNAGDEIDYDDSRSFKRND